MPTAYDPAVIQGFADRLYAEARTVVALATGLGAIVGGLAGFIAGGDIHGGSVAGGCGGGSVLGLVGLAIGLHRATSLRLQAQLALCQLQIEANTRRR